MRPRTCRRCGCTDARACPGGCCWTHVRDVCSECLTSQEWIANAADLILMRPTRTRFLHIVEFVRYCLEEGRRPTLRLARQVCPVSRAELNRCLNHVADEIIRRRAELLARVLPC